MRGGSAAACHGGAAGRLGVDLCLLLDLELAEQGIGVHDALELKLLGGSGEECHCDFFVAIFVVRLLAGGGEFGLALLGCWPGYDRAAVDFERGAVFVEVAWLLAVAAGPHGQVPELVALGVELGALRLLLCGESARVERRASFAGVVSSEEGMAGG